MSLFSFKKPAGNPVQADSPRTGVSSTTNKLASLLPGSQGESVSSEIPDITPPIAKKDGLKLFGKAGAKSASAPKVNQPKSASASFSSKFKASFGDTSSNVSGNPALLTELDNGKQVYWSVGENSLTQVQGIPSLVASFSKQDHAYFTDIPLTRKQAIDFALSELGEECRVVNKSKDLQYIFAAIATRVSSVPTNTGPGAALAIALLKNKVEDATDAITGFLLKDEASGMSLAVLYFRASNGVMSSPQITVNPDNLSFTLNQFAASKKVSADVPTFLFNNAEFVSVFNNLVVYPKESYFLGIPVSVILGLSVIGSLFVAGASGTYAAANYVEMSSATAKKESLTASASQLKKNISSHIAESLSQFSRTQSIDIDAVSARAGEIWHPYTKVSVTASVKEQRFTVALPLYKDSSIGGGSLLMHNLINEELSSFISKQPPNECIKNSLGISGAIDAIQFEITCQAPDSPIHRYSID